MLLLGLLIRFAAVPLETFLGFEEVSYFVMFAWLGIAGPGPVSLDHFVLGILRPDRLASEYGA
jgi:putative oxidoreductase